MLFPDFLSGTAVILPVSLGTADPYSDIRVLLAFYQDALPAPRTGRLPAKPGEAPTKKVLCPTCDGDRTITRFSRPRPCWCCEGRGWVWQDPYTIRTISGEGAYVPATRTIPCDGCAGQGVHGNGRFCGYCNGVGTLIVSLGPQNPRPGDVDEYGDIHHEACEAAHATSSRLWDQGSFRELETALLELQSRARSLVWECCISMDRDERTLNALEHAELHRILRFLQDRVRLLAGGRLRVPGQLRGWLGRLDAVGKGRWANRAAQGRRNAEIRTRHAEDPRRWSVGKLAREYGLAKSTVQAIVRA